MEGTCSVIHTLFTFQKDFFSGNKDISEFELRIIDRVFPIRNKLSALAVRTAVALQKRHYCLHKVVQRHTEDDMRRRSTICSCRCFRSSFLRAFQKGEDFSHSLCFSEKKLVGTKTLQNSRCAVSTVFPGSERVERSSCAKSCHAPGKARFGGTRPSALEKTQNDRQAGPLGNSIRG